MLVEGTDDEHVIKHICGTRELPDLDDVIPLEGAPQLLEELPIRLRASEGNEDVIGLLIDADTNLHGRWQSIVQRVQGVGYVSLPPSPMIDGTIVEPPPETLLPRFGVWLMPNNRTDGILEDFLRFLVPHPNPNFEHAKESVETIPNQQFSDNDIPKALIHTWLAWQSEPGRPYGTAITSQFLDPNVPEVDVLVCWLQRLYSWDMST